MHAQASAGGPKAALRVVSLNAEATNRGPTFDMDLCELLQADGSPIAYDEARAYFKRDPAHRQASPAASHPPPCFETHVLACPHARLVSIWEQP
jgi:hypothetical protein